MDPAVKKSVLRKIPYGLYVIGVRDKTGVHAFTGSWLSQCSMSPPRLMLGVRHGTHALEALKSGRVFTVNFVSKSDKKVLEQFFKTSAPIDNHFGKVAYSLKKTGAPVLDRAVSFLECEVKHILDAGDHSVVIGEVIDAHSPSHEAALVMSDTPWHYGG